ncbi:MAG: T9SS type A sorting domain-containing protein [Chlorobi bacterium]|nr:T9SS type A sorting domain-containing protein [Chlorobiota bacterium]
MRSADGGENWEQIGFVPGAGTTTGLRNYSYEDDVQASGIKVPVIKYRLVQVDLDGTSKRSPIVEALITGAPTDVALSQNYPNPFNPVTSISYQLSEPGFVSLKVYDAMGREVATLVNATKEAGAYTVKFNGKDLPSGAYMYRMTAGGKTIEKRMVLLK